MSNGKENGAKPRVKLCAIAKDEGAYLAYWVFHHLYFGFDEIHICLNRTTDNSAAILDEIAKTYPNVTYSYYDWVDYLRPEVSKSLQTISYALELSKARENSLVDYVLFIDIDEFWCPEDWESDIATCLEEYDYPESISFQWALEPGSEEVFGLLRRKNNCRLSGHVKTAFSVKADLTQVRIHVPIFKPSVRSIVAGGREFLRSADRDQVLDMEQSCYRNPPYFLIHRVCRSKPEYMAALTNGNADEKYVLKLNRGFGYLGDEAGDFKYEGSEESYERYFAYINSGLSFDKINALLKCEERRVLARAEAFYDAVPEAFKRNRSKFLKSIRGINDTYLDNLIRSISER